MKIKNTLLLLVVAATAAVSCNLFNNWDMDVPMGVDKHANLTPEKLFDVQFDNNLATTPAGDICLSFEPSKGIEKECTLEAGKSKTVKASVTGVKKDRVVLAHNDALLRWYSSNRNVATVDQSGKITATGAGKCTVWAVANNGVRTGVKVTVK